MHCHPVLSYVESYKSAFHQEIMLQPVARFHSETNKKVTS